MAEADDCYVITSDCCGITTARASLLNSLFRALTEVAHNAYDYNEGFTPEKCKAWVEFITEGFKTDRVFQELFPQIAKAVYEQRKAQPPFVPGVDSTATASASSAPEETAH